MPVAIVLCEADKEVWYCWTAALRSKLSVRAQLRPHLSIEYCLQRRYVIHLIPSLEWPYEHLLHAARHIWVEWQAVVIRRLLYNAFRSVQVVDRFGCGRWSRCRR